MASKLIIFYSLYIIYAINNYIYSQDQVNTIYNDHKSKVILSDSLRQKSYEDLTFSFNKFKKDSILSNVYADGYLKKAKLENRIIEIANGYYLKRKISDDNTAIKYIDSMISMTKELNHIDYPAKAYLAKGAFYHRCARYDSALSFYLIAQKHTKVNNNVYQKTSIKHNIGLLKNSVGSEVEALKIFKENLKFIKTQDTINKYLNSYINGLFAISDTYHRLDLPDSATRYINRGLYKSISMGDEISYNTFLLLNGVNNFLLNKHQNALDTLYKVSKRIQDSKNDPTGEIYCNSLIAETLTKMNRKEEALPYLIKVDSKVNTTNYSKEKRIAFELLISYYRDKGDIENHLKVLSKLIYLDSTLYKRKENLKSDIVIKYESAELINERNRIIKSLKKEKSVSRMGLLILIGISMILLTLLFSYYRKQKLYKKRFDLLIENDKQEAKEIKSSVNNIAKESIGVPIEIADEILEKLEHFEKDLGFLNPNIKMNTVAKKFKTNSSYLSKVININKDKNFTSYINDLRIDFCIEKLKKERKFRLYSIESIGAEVGFNSVQSFSRAFQKKTGLTVSYFIKNTEKQEVT